MVLTTFSWIVISPYALHLFIYRASLESYTDAFFETMSGITTTGATILTDLDNAPPGILF